MPNNEPLSQGKKVQMMKTIMPFVNSPMQLGMTFLIHYMELQNTLNDYHNPHKSICSCEIPSGSSKQIEMLKALKTCCNKDEQEIIDNILNCLCILDNLNN